MIRWSLPHCLTACFHHAVVVQIEGSSYRLRQHAELMPEHVRSKAIITPPISAPVSRRRGRPPKNGHLHPGPDRHKWGLLRLSRKLRAARLIL